MSNTNRRDFLQQTGLGIAGATALSWAAASRAAGANERLRVGLIGCGGRGRYDAGVFAARADAEVVYLADPHQQRLAEAARQFGGKPKTTDDFRRILDDKSVDAVINATPVHWHAPATILACDAGWEMPLRRVRIATIGWRRQWSDTASFTLDWPVGDRRSMVPQPWGGLHEREYSCRRDRRGARQSADSDGYICRSGQERRCAACAGTRCHARQRLSRRPCGDYRRRQRIDRRFGQGCASPGRS